AILSTQYSLHSTFPQHQQHSHIFLPFESLSLSVEHSSIATRVLSLLSIQALRPEYDRVLDCALTPKSS
ncbi:hypothetical protein PHAVU_003G106000, partial [Phaseolus vulgaris]